MNPQTESLSLDLDVGTPSGLVETECEVDVKARPRIKKEAARKNTSRATRGVRIVTVTVTGRLGAYHG